ncbi:Protein FAM13A [Araneus ventricosus]|uniref:Protein FAM13A n=1 Tax=Araneus ventricosus TaxID=182803 RepID=A0A4Y2E345_ARAVE|nr:Protein FAM13A [Araneus ventricosus]
MYTLYDDDHSVKMLAPNQEPPGESRIDKMRKFLSSPLTRKKPANVQYKTFGTPLEVLLQRFPSEHSVPFIITRLCQYILKTGLTHEGLFRISGNARSVERLKASFDRSGDAPLETEGDVSSAAALLKLFLRELPDPIIPMNMHCQFLDAVKDKDKMESIACLAELVEKLPPINYHILNYLFNFLRKVSDMEDQNRMSASSLGIVFGPNLFRVTEDFVGLKEQSLTNQIVTYFISEHDKIFRKDATNFICNTCFASDISKTTQAAAMISSWPEAKSSSSAMLSTWSLGPLCTQNEPAYEEFLQLSSLSHSLTQDDTGHFLSLKPQDHSCTMNNESRSASKDVTEFSSHVSEDLPYENHVAVTSSLKSSMERKTSLGKEFYIMEEESLLSYSSLSDKVSSVSTHSSLTESVSNSSNQSSLSEATSVASSHSSLAEKVFMTSTHSSPNIKTSGASSSIHERDLSFNSAKENSHPITCISSQEGQTNDVDGVRIGLEQLSKLTLEKSEEMMKDTHKIYPRGRRRHIRHPKHRSYSERRSQSELRTNTHYENEDEFNGNSHTHSLYDKNDVQHNSTGSLNESGVDMRHSWPAFRKCKEEEDIALSPLPQQLGTNVCEASVSPSAFRSYLSYRNLHLDPSLPPSPPVEQEDIIIGSSHEVSSSNVKQLNKKIHTLKKKIKTFEDNFEKLYGYKPSNAEKCSNIGVKKMLSELNKARQDLKVCLELKGDPQLWDSEDVMPNKSSRGTNTRSSQGLFSVAKTGAETMSIEETIKNALAYLARHRKDMNRPEGLEEMSKEQLVAEKVAIQKVLLNFESMHGRPASKAHRELVRPLYDRYRLTKRLIVRNVSSKDNADLVPILEHETMDFKKSDLAKNINVDKEVPPVEPRINKDDELDEKDQKTCAPSHINFHELSLSELEAEVTVVRDEKRRLRKLLREFEEQFKKEHGRKAQREDKRAMEPCYTEYKNAKAKLKLLEALVAKYEQSS